MLVLNFRFLRLGDPQCRPLPPFASVNFVAYLRGNSCSAGPFLFQLFPSACFGLLHGVCEG